MSLTSLTTKKTTPCLVSLLGLRNAHLAFLQPLTLVFLGLSDAAHVEVAQGSDKDAPTSSPDPQAPSQPAQSSAQLETQPSQLEKHADSSTIATVVIPRTDKRKDHPKIALESTSPPRQEVQESKPYVKPDPTRPLSKKQQLQIAQDRANFFQRQYLECAQIRELKEDSIQELTRMVSSLRNLSVL